VSSESVHEPTEPAEDDSSDEVRAAAAADKAEVDAAVEDLRANFERWEELLEAQSQVMFEADLGDVYAACNIDGRLKEFALAPDAMSAYTYIELQARINAVLEELRKAVIAEFEANYPGGGFVE